MLSLVEKGSQSAYLRSIDMDARLLEELLNEDESSSLDFKLGQYQLSGSSDDEKSEIVKDILAFANAWRRVDAYILIGVEEVRGGRSIVCGVTDHLGEQDLQQLVNSKTNRPIEFSYNVFPIEGKQIGVIKIPVQDRPFYLVKKYGKLNKDIVYIRRGSSTGICDVDEIARMGAANILRNSIPAVDLQFADVNNRVEKGTEIQLNSLLLHFPDRSQIPKIHVRRDVFAANLGSINSSYYRDYADYFYFQYLMNPVSFILKNTGSTLLTNASIRFFVSDIGGVVFLTQDELPDIPRYNILPPLGNVIDSIVPKPKTLHIEKRGNDHEVRIDIGDIQPKADAISEKLYVGVEETLNITLNATIFADNLPDPIRDSLTIKFHVQEEAQSVDDLLKAIERFTEEKKREIEEEIGDGNE